MDRRSIALFVVVMAAVMDLLDGTVVNIVLPSIMRDIGAGSAQAAAVASAYTLALGVLLATGGRLGDVYGHRRVLAVGTAGFVGASVLCATALAPGWLIGARAVQGAMSAVMVPQVLAVIQTLYPADQRGRAFGLFASVAGVATVSGLFVGALLTQADILRLGWRTVFLVNVPLGCAVLAGVRLVPGSRPHPDAGGMDLAGVGWLTAGLLLVVAPLLAASEPGAPRELFLVLLAAVPVMAAFVRHERRRARAGRTPLVDPSLFAYRSFLGALLVQAFVYAAVFATFFTLALYVQRGLGWSPLHAAATVLPWALGVALTSSVASARLVPRFGRRVLDVGLALMLCGLSGTALALQGSAPAPSSWELAPGLFVAGCGMGMVIAPVLGLGLADIPDHLAGTASGLVNNVQHVAGAAGIAVVSVGFFAHFDAGAAHGDAIAADATTAFRTSVWGVAGLVACAVPLVRLLPVKAAAR